MNAVLVEGLGDVICSIADNWLLNWPSLIEVYIYRQTLLNLPLHFYILSVKMDDYVIVVLQDKLKKCQQNLDQLQLEMTLYKQEPFPQLHQ